MPKYAFTLNKITYQPCDKGNCTVGSITGPTTGPIHVDASGVVHVTAAGDVVLKFGAADSYNPIGVAFKSYGGPDSPGADNFTTRGVDVKAGTISFHATKKDVPVGGVPPRWKLLIVIQNPNDSSLGVIDPDMQNDN